MAVISAAYYFCAEQTQQSRGIKQHDPTGCVYHSNSCAYHGTFGVKSVMSCRVSLSLPGSQDGKMGSTRLWRVLTIGIEKWTAIVWMYLKEVFNMSPTQENSRESCSAFLAYVKFTTVGKTRYFWAYLEAGKAPKNAKKSPRRWEGSRPSPPTACILFHLGHLDKLADTM